MSAEESKIEAIEFLVWVSISPWIADLNGSWFNIDNAFDSPHITAEQLYDIWKEETK